MSIEIIPTGAALGAEIRGVDLARPIDDEMFAAIERAYNDHGVIFFRDQHITPPRQVAFTRCFGEIEFNIFVERWSVPGSPEIVVVSNVTEDGRPIGVRRAGENWHSDMCYAARPPLAQLYTCQRDGFRDQGTRADPDLAHPWSPRRDRTAEPNNKDSR